MCGSWQTPEIDNAAATPLSGANYAIDKAGSDDLPGGVYAEGPATRGARQAPEVDNATAGPASPLRRDAGVAKNAFSHGLPRLVDAKGYATRGTR